MKNIRGKKPLTASNYGKKAKLRENIGAWLLMIPAVFILYILVWRPTVLGFVYSLFSMRGYNIVKFNGIQNYIQVITHTQFLTMLFNTVKYVIWSFIIGFLPSIFIAIMLNDDRTHSVLDEFVAGNGDVIDCYDASLLKNIIKIICNNRFIFIS